MTNEDLNLLKNCAETFNATCGVLANNDYDNIKKFVTLVNYACHKHLLIYSRKTLKSLNDCQVMPDPKDVNLLKDLDNGGSTDK